MENETDRLRGADSAQIRSMIVVSGPEGHCPDLIIDQVTCYCLPPCCSSESLVCRIASDEYNASVLYEGDHRWVRYENRGEILNASPKKGDDTGAWRMT